jgi:hypothetical protein
MFSKIIQTKGMVFLQDITTSFLPKLILAVSLRCENLYG